MLAFLKRITWGGFAERSYWGVYYVWFVAVAFKLRGMARSPYLAVQSER